MDSAYAEIVHKRRDRAIAIILGVKEKEVDRFLSPVTSSKLRKVVLDQLNDLTDFALDIIKTLDSGDNVPNEEYFQRLEMKIDEILTR